MIKRTLRIGLGMAVCVQLALGPASAAEPKSVPMAVAPVLAATSPAASTPALAFSGWPAQGAITYRVLLGSGGIQVGEARHHWSHDSKRYRMEVTVRTTGFAALLKNFQYVQQSQGELGPQGLRPELFSVAHLGKALETAVFDWDNAKVSIRRGERERRTAQLHAGDQDVLSLWHQIGIVGAAGLPRTLTVVGNKEAKTARLEAVGEEALRLPIGNIDALRLRVQAEDGTLTIDIWLARSHGMLPVRIRMVDDKGEVLDQQAVELSLPPAGDAPARTTDKTANAELKQAEPATPPGGRNPN